MWFICFCWFHEKTHNLKKHNLRLIYRILISKTFLSLSFHVNKQTDILLLLPLLTIYSFSIIIALTCQTAVRSIIYCDKKCHKWCGGRCDTHFCWLWCKWCLQPTVSRWSSICGSDAPRNLTRLQAEVMVVVKNKVKITKRILEGLGFSFSLWGRMDIHWKTTCQIFVQEELWRSACCGSGQSSLLPSHDAKCISMRHTGKGAHIIGIWWMLSEVPLYSVLYILPCMSRVSQTNAPWREKKTNTSHTGL